VDYPGGTTVTPDRKNTAQIATATTTDIVPAPGASVSRNVKHLNIRNAHATIPNPITVQHTDGTHVETLFSCTLQPGEALVFADGVGWRVFDAVGNLKTTTATTIVQQAAQMLTSDLTVPADTSLVVNRTLTINTGKKLTLGLGARLRIL